MSEREKPSKPPPKRGGKTRGVCNYTLEDLNILIDIMEDVLPVIEIHWTQVTSRYNLWAQENTCPSRDSTSLQKK